MSSADDTGSASLVAAGAESVATLRAQIELERAMRVSLENELFAARERTAASEETIAHQHDRQLATEAALDAERTLRERLEQRLYALTHREDGVHGGGGGGGGDHGDVDAVSVARMWQEEFSREKAERLTSEAAFRELQLLHMAQMREMAQLREEARGMQQRLQEALRGQVAGQLVVQSEIEAEAARVADECERLTRQLAELEAAYDLLQRERRMLTDRTVSLETQLREADSRLNSRTELLTDSVAAMSRFSHQAVDSYQSFQVETARLSQRVEEEVAARVRAEEVAAQATDALARLEAQHEEALNELGQIRALAAVPVASVHRPPPLGPTLSNMSSVSLSSSVTGAGVGDAAGSQMEAVSASAAEMERTVRRVADLVARMGGHVTTEVSSTGGGSAVTMAPVTSSSMQRAFGSAAGAGMVRVVSSQSEDYGDELVSVTSSVSSHARVAPALTASELGPATGEEVAARARSPTVSERSVRSTSGSIGGVSNGTGGVRRAQSVTTSSTGSATAAANRVSPKTGVTATSTSPNRPGWRR
jgi:hypothetical protein